MTLNRKQNSNSDGALTIFIALIAIVLMPIASIYLLTKDSTKEKVIGTVFDYRWHYPVDCNFAAKS